MVHQEHESENGEIQSGDEVFTGYISGLTFKNKPVQYTIVDGLAIFEGDIVLGTAQEMQSRSQAILSGDIDAAQDDLERGVALSGAQYRWPNATMPYEIDPALSNQTRITDAIAHITANTNLRFVARTGANADQHPNYVRFRPSTGCSSMVGMRGGRQFINLANGCGTGNTIHEMLHAFGVWHEQSREDRDTKVTIHWQNIQAGKEDNFNQHNSDSDDHGAYDYGSIMHYPTWAFSKNDQSTITTKPPGIAIGQRTGMSSGDIATVHAIYTTWHTNKIVSQVYSTYHSQNAWALIQGLGWIKIKTGNKDGVTNTFVILCEAKANNHTVNVFADGRKLYRVYLN